MDDSRLLFSLLKSDSKVSFLMSIFSFSQSMSESAGVSSPLLPGQLRSPQASFRISSNSLKCDTLALCFSEPLLSSPTTPGTSSPSSCDLCYGCLSYSVCSVNRNNAWSATIMVTILPGCFSPTIPIWMILYLSCLPCLILKGPAQLWELLLILKVSWLIFIFTYLCTQASQVAFQSSVLFTQSEELLLTIMWPGRELRPYNMVQEA